MKWSQFPQMAFISVPVEIQLLLQRGYFQKFQCAKPSSSSSQCACDPKDEQLLFCLFKYCLLLLPPNSWLLEGCLSLWKSPHSTLIVSSDVTLTSYIFFFRKFWEIFFRVPCLIKVKIFYLKVIFIII